MWIKFTFVALLITTVCGETADHVRPRHLRQSSAGRSMWNAEEELAEYWRFKAQAVLANKLEAVRKVKTDSAKNVIMFLGDGMSIHTVTATRNLIGDSNKQVYFEQFPYTGLSKTYCVNRQVADSACTSTAYLCGVKANYGTIGITADVARYNCTGAYMPQYQVDSIAKWAQDAGKWAGLVTSARVTHASPAGMYAHIADRYWENDVEVKGNGCDPTVTVDIARQLVESDVGKELRVILGGGRREFRNATLNDEEGYRGYRSDGRNLIADWIAEKANKKGHYVWSKTGLNKLNLNDTDYLLGLFAPNHLPYEGDRVRNHRDKADPSLSELTEAAIKVLQRNDQGYVLFVEGAKIDMAHHDGYVGRSLEDTAEFGLAVQRAREMTSSDDTLIVVTADHAHTMTINGYPWRNEDIVTGMSDRDGDDELPFSILSYANGPGFGDAYDANGRKRLRSRLMANPDYQHPATVPRNSESHGGDDVAVYASGPFAQFFSGNYEQSNIAAMMARAAGIGPYANINP